jgi:hypothetical protein
MNTTWLAIWAEVKRAARQAPRMYAAPGVGAIRQTRLVLRQIERENRARPEDAGRSEVRR